MYMSVKEDCPKRPEQKTLTKGTATCSSPPSTDQVSDTASINRSNTAVRAVLEQPCSTGGRTGTVRPKQEPTGRTDLSDRSRLVLCDRSQELIGQAYPTRRQVLRSDSACPTTGRTRLFEHRSNCRVRPVNAGSVRALRYRPPLKLGDAGLNLRSFSESAAALWAVTGGEHLTTWPKGLA
ncbi:hypothetical protein PCANC_24820 [Puccinia coronata f. sp. avenae]|uniref:Uncharacterized protein n=1 Tax=Puccinia coronata f. sp. avenae TaxID=200324 RepID=A0A2N5TJK7_9BASI|nr:hypothetical protein PCANC_24820 [Puccinia coronata f. sp. avenae]